MQTLILPTQTMNTGDSGVELEFNKRNRIRTGIKWEDIAKMGQSLRVAEAQKQNVYPKPDYEKLVADGMPAFAARIVKSVYDSMSTTPAVAGANITDENIQHYIAGVNRVMAGVMTWAQSFASLETSHSIIKMMEDSPKNRPYHFVYPMGNPWKYYADECRTISSNTFFNALQLDYHGQRRALKDLEMGWPAKCEAWQKRGQIIVETAKGVEINPLSEIGHIRINDTWSKCFKTKEEAVAYKASLKAWLLVDKYGRILGDFASREEAVEHARSATKHNANATVSDKGIAVTEAERTGPDHRGGDDVSSDKLREIFGFKGVNFGNWLKGESNLAERQLHLNHGYDSFMDLAILLNIPPKAVSLNGMLGVAIGAQGNGGSAAAHFVPGMNEINLTRTNGAGSLAHEWAHALDHYFATLAGFAGRIEPYLTENADHRTVASDIRPEIVEKFAAIVDAMNRRPQTPEEALEVARKEGAKIIRYMESWLEHFKTRFLNAKVNEAVFDTLADKIRALDLGGEKILVGKPSSRPFFSKTIYPRLAELRSLYKEKTGRFYSLDEMMNLQGNVDALVHSRSAATKPGASGVVTTNYSAAALTLDINKGGKAYWSTNLEKFARAFDAFVSDKLEAAGQKNSYLTHTGRDDSSVPKGTERKAISKAFQALFNEIRVEETQNGKVILI
jgi:hypothetical protein